MTQEEIEEIKAGPGLVEIRGGYILLEYKVLVKIDRRPPKRNGQEHSLMLRFYPIANGKHEKGHN